MQQWKRLPAADAAGTNSNDTTEVQIGAGLGVPSWAKSIRALHAKLTLLALTSDEEVAGYIRLANDEGGLDPLNFPLPIAQTLTGAIGTHITRPVTVPCFHSVVKHDTIRAYAAFDAGTTGVHTLQAYLLFSSKSVPFEMKAQKSAVIAASATANTEAGAATLSTIAGKTSGLLGFWAYITAAGGITVAQTPGGYVKIASDMKDWVTQRVSTNMLTSGLSTAVLGNTRPMVCAIEEVLKRCDGVGKLPFPDIFPVDTKQDFDFTNYMDGTNTAAPGGRYGLLWKE